MANKVATSQLALPAATCNSVYNTTGYSTSKANLASSSLATDNVFRDGYSHQLASVTGNTTTGFTAALTIDV